MDEQKNPVYFLPVLAVVILSGALYATAGNEHVSAVGDPGMRRDGLRLAIESWNQCNEVGEEVPHMGSPRAADCFDIYKASPKADGKIFRPFSLRCLSSISPWMQWIQICLFNVFIYLWWWFRKSCLLYHRIELPFWIENCHAVDR